MLIIVDCTREKHGGVSMSELQKAIEEIMYEGEKFPARALKTIVANRDESLPYLRNAMDKAIAEGDDLEEDFQLHFLCGFFTWRTPG